MEFAQTAPPLPHQNPNSDFATIPRWIPLEAAGGCTALMAHERRGFAPNLHLAACSGCWSFSSGFVPEHFFDGRLPLPRHPVQHRRHAHPQRLRVRRFTTFLFGYALAPGQKNMVGVTTGIRHIF
ncbi:hypothetical protein [Cupriavidus lacunae]|uniref:Uncharacterized protein n=1 Tax=Cupriavidus lacunae TaxID=2666307 RepID=A0A370NI10_9BURK|nr:hypothetical protein [Cupriavidus lacunae]RDK05232.1 hypothetical protein DN412_38195 [Cupriavidus lacunae]